MSWTRVWGFPGGASGKEPACQCRRHKGHRFDPWVRKIPWRRVQQATHSSILAWRIPWTEEPGRLQSIVSQRVRHDWRDLAHRTRAWTFDKAFQAPQALSDGAGASGEPCVVFRVWLWSPSSGKGLPALPSLRACCGQEDWKDAAYLGRGAVELQQPILQPLHLGPELPPVPAQQALVESDELQEWFGCCVVVALLVAQIGLGGVVDTCVDKSHELTNWWLDCGLESNGRE